MRHGVQKPQLSWAKKSTKLCAMSNASRLRLNTIKAPALGTSSKAMRRPNSSLASVTPDAPPTCTAWVSCAPQSASTSATVTPKGYSYTPGNSQSPEMDSNLVPLDEAVPLAA